MKSNTAYRTKLRAVFLAAIMVTSVVGMSVAFTGSAVALTDEAYNPDFPYQGQDVVYQNTTEVTDTSVNYELRRVTSFNNGVESSTFVRELDDIDTNDNTITIETGDLEAGDYFIRGGGLPRNPDEDDTFEVRVQDLDVEFDDDIVTDSGADSITELDIDSNRGTYTLIVDAEGDLDEGELAGIHITVENADGLDDVDEAFLADELTTNASSVTDSITLEKYIELLAAVRAGVTFEDGDLDEDLNITAETELNEVGLGNITIEEANGSADLIVEDTTTFGAIATPNETDDYDVNPFNALLLNEDTDDADETVIMLGIRDTAADVSFNGIDADDYTFNFNVEDTEASGSVDITVREEAQDGSFSQGTYSAGAGDIAHFEFDLDDTGEAWIQIGDADSDFVDVLYVDVDDEDELVEVAVNTRLLGAPGAADTDSVYNVENADNVISLLHGTSGNFNAIEDTTSQLFHDDGSPQGAAEYYEELDLINDAADVDDGAAIREEMLNRPIQAIDYELQLASDGDDDGIFDSDAGAGEASDQLDAAVLELQAASIGDIRTWVAPEDDADDVTDVDELLEIVTERDEIADGDRLIVEVEATGLYGGIIAGGPDSNDDVDPSEVDFDRLNDGVSSVILDDFFDVENINFDIEAEDVTGQDPIAVRMDDSSDDSDVYVLIGPDQDRFFLVVNSDSDDAFTGSAPVSKSFTAELEFDADDGSDRFEFDGEAFRDDQNYPYLRAGDTLEGSAAFEFVESMVSFDNLNADDEIQAENIDDSEISGETNIAPGSDATLRVSSTDASTSFRIGQSVDIEGDGTISAEFDFSGQEVGDEFDTRFRASGSTIDTVNSVIVEEGSLGVADPVDDEDDVVDDDDDVVDDDDDVVDDTDDQVSDDTDDETPGFGALVALIALIGAALLAARRQN